MGSSFVPSSGRQTEHKGIRRGRSAPGVRWGSDIMLVFPLVLPTANYKLSKLLQYVMRIVRCRPWHHSSKPINSALSGRTKPDSALFFSCQTVTNRAKQNQGVTGDAAASCGILAEWCFLFGSGSGPTHNGAGNTRSDSPVSADQARAGAI